MLVNDGGSDAMDRVAAFLQWEDLDAITRCCRATRDQDTSAFYRAWVATTTLVLPPDSLASHAILSTITDIDAVVVPHSKWLDVVLADKDLGPRLARVRRVTLDRNRFQVKPREDLHLSVIADTFPETTHLKIHRLEYVYDARELRTFRGLRSLELSTQTKNLACAISATDFSSLEELKLTRIDLHTIQSKEALVNLRSLELNDLGLVHNLMFLRHARRLSELSLENTQVVGTAVDDLHAIAPQLKFFKCGTIDPFCPRHSSRVDTDRLALAFKNLETLIYKGEVDLSSISLIGTLRVLQLLYVETQDVSPLSKLVRLERLDIRSTSFVDTSPLVNLPRLVSFTYSHYREGGGTHSELASLRSHYLQVFEAPRESSTPLDDQDSLRSLNVYVYPRDGTLAQLPLCRAPRLHKLVISQMVDLSDLHVHFPRVRDLSLTTPSYSYQFTGPKKILPPLADVLTHVARLQDLVSLHLEVRSSFAEYYDDQRQAYVRGLNFHQLAPLRNLRKLKLTYGNIASFEGIEVLSSLRELDAEFGGLPTLDLSPLVSLPDLQVLTLLGCGDNTDVSPLTRILSLRVVSLPKGIDCCPLVVAYHAARLRLPGATALPVLREVRIGPKKNCLWGVQYSAKRVKFQLRAMANRTTTGQQSLDTVKAPE